MTKQNKNIKSMTYQIIKPLDCDWKELGKALRDIQYETKQILNKAIQLAWEYEGFSSDYKKKYGEYPNIKDVLNYSNVLGYAYDKLKDEYFKLNTGNLTQTIKRATDKFKSDKLDILKGNKSIANFKKDCPIDIKQYNVYKEDEFYSVNISLISNSYKKELERKSGQFLVAIKAGDETQRAILDRIISGDYKKCASQISTRKNKWFLNITYEFDQKVKEVNPNKVMGVDLGITNIATMQILDISKNKYDWLKYNQCVIVGKELIKQRQKIEQRKRELGKQAKYCGEGRMGHGYKTRMKPLDKMGDKIAKFRDTYNHRVSKYIVDFAVKNECGVIQLENLSGFSVEQSESMLKNWSYHDLQTKIKYKAEGLGIKVVMINPKHTSQRCNKCGSIHKDNRDCKNNQAKFECVACGHKDNADVNAARNIAIPGIESIINEQLKSVS